MDLTNVDAVMFEITRNEGARYGTDGLCGLVIQTDAAITVSSTKLAYRRLALGEIGTFTLDTTAISGTAYIGLAAQGYTTASGQQPLLECSEISTE